MRFVIEGRLRPSCGLGPAEYFALAVKEWEMVLGWVAAGVALAYGRPVSPPGGTLVVDVASERDAQALAAALPLAPYAEVTVRRAEARAPAAPAAPPAPPTLSARRALAAVR
jgi:hypothetical protein